ncbi:MAG: metallophosphoesterase [Myxococcales bacterium]|nr:MAG: metallophosphoesterase [Myxococcales bacterium]
MGASRRGRELHRVAPSRPVKLRIASDLHVEFMRDDGRTIAAELVADEDFDVLVLAGDLCSLKGLRAALSTVSEAARGRPVVYVLGNHDAYGGTREAALGEARRAASACTNLTVLEQEVAVIEGQRFVGCTLWVPHPGSPDHTDDFMGDFRYIHDIYGWLPATAARSARFLVEQVRPGDVVVTHHLPHPGSIHPRYAGSPLNRYFLHDLTPVVEQAGAALWVHGHTHASCDYRAGATRVVCNPFGYARASPGEPNPRFDGAFTVALPRA